MTADSLGHAIDLAGVRAAHEQAVAASRSGNPATAGRLLQQSLRRLRDAPSTSDIVTLRMQILITFAKVESELRDVETGLRRLDEATQLLASGPDDVVLTALHNQRGALLARMGRYDEATRSFDTATRYFRAAEVRDVAAVLLNRSTALMLTGKMRQAEADLEKCVGVAVGDELVAMREMALHNLGYLRFLLGDLPSALATMEQANQQENRGVALLDRARVLLEAGLVREADETLSQAAEIVRRDRLPQDLGEVELERARCALIGGDVRAARRYASSARDRFRRRGSDRWRRSAELVLLQADLAAGRPGSRLLQPALRVHSEFADVGLRLQARTAALIAAEAALAAGELDLASQLVAQLGAADRRDPITARLHTRYVRAAVHHAHRAHATASRVARSGLSELVGYQATFGSIDLQTAAAVHGRRLAELDIAIALDSGRPAHVVRAAELARAASNRLPVVRPPADRDTADLLAELRRAAESLHATQDRDESLSLQRRRRQLEGRIAARGWTLAGPGETRDVAKIRDMQATAHRCESALVMYVESRGQLHAVVVGPSLRLYGLGSASVLAEQVRRARADLDVLAQPVLPEAMRAAARSSFERSVRALDAAMVAPIGVDGQRLVIVSTGVFGQLPWSSLPSLRGVPVVVAPSATAWLAATNAARRRRREVVAFSGPGLPFGDREVKSVAAAWADADVHVGNAAGRRALVKALDSAAVVHVAAHGVHQTENAMFSSLRMADGLLFAHELDRTRRTAEHVVLSACELGLATVRPGDEALGLTSVLLRLGSRSIVAGVARVNDEVAADVMTDYHRRLAGGADSAQALADAIAATHEVAPFVCFGSAWHA